MAQREVLFADIQHISEFKIVPFFSKHLPLTALQCHPLPSKQRPTDFRDLWPISKGSESTLEVRKALGVMDVIDSAARRKSIKTNA